MYIKLLLQCARRSGRSRNPTSYRKRRGCRRHARARSCAVCCARSRWTIATWAISRRWLTRVSSICSSGSDLPTRRTTRAIFMKTFTGFSSLDLWVSSWWSCSYLTFLIVMKSLFDDSFFVCWIFVTAESCAMLLMYSMLTCRYIQADLTSIDLVLLLVSSLSMCTISLNAM